MLMRVIASFEVSSGSEDLDYDPISGCHDPTDLVSGPGRFKLFFKPRDVGELEKILGDQK